MSDECGTATQESRHVRCQAHPLIATRGATPPAFQPPSLGSRLFPPRNLVPIP